MRKILSLLILVVLCCGVFSACKNKNAENAGSTEHVHSFGEWEEKKPATCYEAGEKERTCECGEKENEIIPKLEHKYENGACIYCSKKKPSEGFLFTKKGEEWEITGIGDCLDTDIVIPEEHQGLPVTSIGEEAFINVFDNFDSIYIPDSVKSIGKRAFLGCESLKTAVLPKALTRIEESLFEGCVLLESVNIPEGVTVLDARAFYGCNNLSVFTLPSTLQIIGDKAFSGCYSIVDIVIPDGVKEIGVQAFAFCTSMSTVTLPASLEKLGDMSFMISGTSMKSFFYEGSKEQWNKIEKGNKWNYFITDCPIVYDYVKPENAVKD